MEAKIRTVPSSAAIPRDAVRPVRRRRHDEDEHEFEEVLAGQAEGAPRRAEPTVHAVTSEQPAAGDDEVGSQLDVLG